MSAPLRNNFNKLWTRQTRFHSPFIFSRLRRRKLQNPRPALIWPNTGSMITFRREYSSRPHLFCHTGRIKVVNRLVHHWHRLTNVIRLIRDVCGNDNLLFVGHRLSIPALVETFVRSSLLCHPATVARPSATRLHDTESTRPETTAAGASDAEGESRRCGAKVRNAFAYDHPKSRVGGTAFHDFPQIKTKLRKVSGRAASY